MTKREHLQAHNMKLICGASLALLAIVAESLVYSHGVSQQGLLHEVPDAASGAFACIALNKHAVIATWQPWGCQKRHRQLSVMMVP